MRQRILVVDDDHRDAARVDPREIEASGDDPRLSDVSEELLLRPLLLVARGRAQFQYANLAVAALFDGLEPLLEVFAYVVDR